MTPPAFAPLLQGDAVSPCTGVCLLHAASGLCQGCKRTAAEIGAWIGLSPLERCAVLEALPARDAGPAAVSCSYFHV